ncbi:MAG: Hsp20/alpha crystallin family protein [Burkholderiales bacterium]|nr:Hsp20/alpha crystallin family protein [Burkholderiales bacterium]
MNKLVSRGHLFDDLFRDFSPGYYIKPLHGEALPNQVKVDVKEDQKCFTVVADLPGVNREAITVEIDSDTVSISAEMSQQDQQSEDERVLRNERYFGSVARSLRLPQEVDEANAKARFENGVLTLTLPKKGASGGQRLVIE